MYSNLFRESKRVEIGGVAFNLKKWPARLKNWLTMRMIDGAVLDSAQGVYTNFHPMARPFREVEDECLEKVFLGVESWGLRESAPEGERPVPVNRQAVSDLYNLFPGVFSALLIEVEEFNNSLSVPEGEPSTSALTT